MKTFTISQFYGGDAVDEKLGRKNQFANTSTGIDIYYKPSILRGNLKMETVETGATSARMIDFVKGSDGTTYGLGYLLYGGANIYMTLWKLTGTTWSAAGTASASAPVEDSQVVEYKDYLYCYTQTNKIGRYGTLSSSPTFTEDWQTTTNSLTINGPMAVTNNELYIANGNLIASWDGTTWTPAAYTLPSQWTIVSMIPWGKYLALGVRLPGSVTSKLIFWDTAELTIWEFAKDCPEGELIGIRNVGDVLKGLVLNPATDGDHDGYLNVIDWRGGAVSVAHRKQLSGLVSSSLVFRNNGLDSRNGTLYIGGVTAIATNLGGIWAWGQPVPGGRFAFNHAFSMGTTTLQHFHCLKWIGSFLYASIYDSTGTDYKIVRSSSTASAYEDLSYDSLIFDGGKPYMDKEMVDVILNHNALPANAVVTLKYKVNRASSWTTIGTSSTTSATQKTFNNISGVNLDDFKELQLQVSTNMSTGDGLIEITGITVRYNELEIPA